MKTRFKILFLTALIAVLTGCSAQKRVATADADSVASETLYDQALKALDEQRFIIKGDEFFLPGAKDLVKYSSDSHISMRDKRAAICFSRTLFPSSLLGNQYHAVDLVAEITKGKRAKNGDMKYTMKIYGDNKWLEYIVLVSLYKNTNACFVQFNAGKNGFNIFNFRGEVYPAAD